MRNKKPAQSLHRRVWRVSSQAPLGEMVDIEVTPQARSAEPEPKSDEAVPSLHAMREIGWRQSSLELSDGLDVHEDHDTVPGDLWDEFFKP